MRHNGACKFTGEHYGIVTCDQGEHDAVFCMVCGNSLPPYLELCYKCKEAERKVPHLQQSLDALYRALVKEQL